MLPIQKILCAVDFNEPSRSALNLAAHWAHVMAAELRVIHVIPSLTPDLILGMAGLLPSDTERHEEASWKLNALLEHHVPLSLRVRSEVRVGDAAQQILCAAQDHQADLLVLATHGHTGLKHLVLGSVAEAVVRSAPCPVLTIHQWENKTPDDGPISAPVTKILCPIDGSEASLAALKLAGNWAVQFDAKLHVLTVVPELTVPVDIMVIDPELLRVNDVRCQEASKQMDSAVKSCVPAQLSVEKSVRWGNAVDQIIELSEQQHTDLIVLATHGRTGWGHLFLGSVAEGVVRKAPCPVLTIHSSPYSGGKPGTLCFAEAETEIGADEARVAKESEN